MKTIILLLLIAVGCTQPSDKRDSTITDSSLIRKANQAGVSFLKNRSSADSLATILDQVAQYEIDTTTSNYVLVSIHFKRVGEVKTHLMYVTLDRNLSVTNSYEL